MQPICLVGKTVNIGDNSISFALELLQYFYPDFKIIQQGDMFPEGDNLIYVHGRSYQRTREWLPDSGRKVIYTYDMDNAKENEFDFVCDYDFTNRNQLLKLVYSKWGIDYSYVLAEDDLINIERMDLFDFYNFIKPRWISENLCQSDETITQTNVHNIIGQRFDNILRFNDNITDENAPLLELGILQFIETARSTKRSRNKAYSKYNALYRKFNDKHSDNRYIALTLAKYREMENTKRFKLIWLLSQFSF